MKKNIGGLFIVLIALFTIINTMTVNADIGQLSIQTVSTQAAVGSEVVLLIETTNNYGYSLDFNFDINVLEFVDAEASLKPFVGSVAGDAMGTISKNVSNGKLSLSYTYGDFSSIDYVVVKFKVKSSENGEANITVANVGNTYQGTGNKTITFNIATEKECLVCEQDEVSCPVCEECEKCEATTNVNKETISKESNATDSKDILLYGALGTCGFLAVVVVTLAIRKK